MPNLFEEQSCSQLSFSVGKGTTEPIRVDQLQRAREPVSRSKSGVQGKVADVFHGRSRHAESQKRTACIPDLAGHGTSGCMAGTAVRDALHHEGARHRYTPDILVVWGGHPLRLGFAWRAWWWCGECPRGHRRRLPAPSSRRIATLPSCGRLTGNVLASQQDNELHVPDF